MDRRLQRGSGIVNSTYVIDIDNDMVDKNKIECCERKRTLFKSYTTIRSTYFSTGSICAVSGCIGVINRSEKCSKDVKYFVYLVFFI